MGVLLWRVPRPFKLGSVAADGRLSHQATCPKEFGWLVGSLGLGGKSLQLKASMIGGWQAMPLLNYNLAFALQLRKSMENISYCSRVDRPRIALHLTLRYTWLLRHQLARTPPMHYTGISRYFLAKTQAY
ncbi:hypothetical protein L798_09470 [Zootermopsis nevadensis]|uniref:Uncharacterized protein n=1 Tax=Zootermopsis nevadensis TaxID=136037 RepID=A0A067QEI0_ZOONE|nr:hypothetical protein L798_09470 [Zootermopsis nevadensis]